MLVADLEPQTSRRKTSDISRVKNEEGADPEAGSKP